MLFSIFDTNSVDVWLSTVRSFDFAIWMFSSFGKIGRSSAEGCHPGCRASRAPHSSCLARFERFFDVVVQVVFNYLNFTAQLLVFGFLSGKAFIDVSHLVPSLASAGVGALSFGGLLVGSYLLCTR